MRVFSLAIDVGKVVSVLLSDGWHVVEDDSFDLGVYEFRRVAPNDGESRVVFESGSEDLIPDRGFKFKTVEGWLYGPVTEVLAVRVKE